MNGMSDQFTCDGCGGTFDKASDVQARDEVERNFGEHVRPEDCARLCDGCYGKVMGQLN